MRQRDDAIKSISHSLNCLRYQPHGDDWYMTSIRFGMAFGRICMASTAGLISLQEKELLTDLAHNAADQAAACQRQREASHG